MFKNKRQTQTKKCEKPKRVTRHRKSANKTLFANRSKLGADKRSSTDNTISNHGKITSERVTVPLQFFNEGVKSKTVQKTTKGCISKEQSGSLNEDLNAFMQTVSTSSANVSQNPPSDDKQSPHIQTHFSSVTDYYVTLQSPVLEQKSQGGRDTKSGGNSLFKEINCQFLKAAAKQDVSNQNYENVKKNCWSFGSISNSPLLIINKKAVDDGYFCKKLKQQLDAVVLSSRRAQCIRKIASLVAEINTILEGQENVAPLEAVSRNATKYKIEENVTTAGHQLIPKSKWLYKTPRGQKLCRPVVNNCNTELKQYLLQSKVDFELDVATTPLDFLNTKFDTAYSFLTTAIYDVANCSVFNYSQSFNENFKIPPTNGKQHIHPMRTVKPLFHNNNIPPFEDTNNTFLCNTKNPVVSHRPINTAVRKIVRQNMATPTCLLFGRMAKRQKLLFTDHQKEENAESSNKKDEIAATAPAQTYFQLNSGNSKNKEHCRPQDFSNHPKSNPVDETFTIDENFLLPTIPNLGDPLPLSFYPKETFNTE